MKKSKAVFPFLWTAFVLICSVKSIKPCPPSSNYCYIFTCPRSLQTGATNQLQLIRNGKELCAGYLNVTITYQASSLPNQTTLEKHYPIEKGARDTYLELYLDRPEDNSYIYNGQIMINGSYCGNEFSGSDSVYFSNSQDCVVLIQTDKYLYKEGETVLFRVLSIDKDLKPCANNLELIWVENPKGQRLFQWKDVNLKKVSGMKQFDFPLDYEPMYGVWIIYVKCGQNTFSITFEVKEYVLPKYEVTIQTPPYVLITDAEIKIKVCATYTYGKPVHGYVNITASLEPYWWADDKVPTVEYDGKIDGCVEYKINVSLIATTNDYYRRIQVVAIVEEAGTGVQINSTQYIQRQYYPFNLNFNTIYEYQFFKPGLPYIGQLFVRYPDNTPVKGEDIQICYTVDRERVMCNWTATRTTKVCSNFTSDCEGNIEFIIRPQSIDSTGITVSAVSLRYARKDTDPQPANSLYQPQTSISLSAWYSSSGNFIQLQAVENPVRCGSEKGVRLLFTSKESGNFKFHYQVLSQSKVVQSGVIHQTFCMDDDVSSSFEDDCKLIKTTEVLLNPPIESSGSKPGEEDCCSCSEKHSKYVPPVGEAIVDLDVDARWSPCVILLVYYIRPDRETIGDSLRINIQQCFKNQVRMKFKDTTKPPGTNTSITVSASSYSLCGIRIVDKSVTLLNPGNQLTEDKIFDIKRSMDTNLYYQVDSCNRGQSGLPAIIFRPPGGWSYSPYQDTLAAFYAAGFLVISDCILFTRPCKSSGGGNNIVFKNSAGAGGIAMDGVMSTQMPAVVETLPDAEMGAPTVSAVDVRNYFPPTWLFSLVMTGKTGKFTKKLTLPHTITQWDGNAICINCKDGLGISNTTSIQGFQAFFLSFTLPYSIIRGEVLTLIVTIFSYVKDALQIIVSIDTPDGFIIIGKTFFVVCITDSSTVEFKLKATKLGQQKMTVRAETAQDSKVCGGVKISDAYARDAMENYVIVEAEGWPFEAVETMLLCPKDGEAVTQIFTFDLPNDAVNDSGRGYFDFTGYLFGKALDNLDNLLILPSGCGEQNMAALAGNVVVYDVLVATNQLTPERKKKIGNNLILGCQRQLQYQHYDGCFSVWGPQDKECSMFLTAFVLRYFYKIYVIGYLADNSTIIQMQDWIVSKQQSDGCFPNIGKIFDRGIQGANSNEDTTAYVYTSLLISKCTNQTALDAAYACMLKNKPTTNYATCLCAYAEIWAGKEDAAKKRIDAIRDKAIVKDGTKHWHDQNATISDDIQTTSYGVFVIAKLYGLTQELLAFIMFLISNLNKYGGFSSTQDTCLGLEALAEFAKLTYSDSVDISLTCTGGGLKNAEITFNKDNETLVNRTMVPTVPSKVTVVAVGTGCVLVQKIVRCNTITSPEKRYFNLEVNITCHDSNCTKAEICASASYIPSDSTSNMAVMELKMLSGMTPDSNDLDKVMADGKAQRCDFESNTIHFYFDQITNNGTTFCFKVTKIFSIANPQPGNAIIYDYYKRGISSSCTYNIAN